MILCSTHVSLQTGNCPCSHVKGAMGLLMSRTGGSHKCEAIFCLSCEGIPLKEDFVYSPFLIPVLLNAALILKNGPLRNCHFWDCQSSSYPTVLMGFLLTTLSPLPSRDVEVNSRKHQYELRGTQGDQQVNFLANFIAHFLGWVKAVGKMNI